MNRTLPLRRLVAFACALALAIPMLAPPYAYAATSSELARHRAAADAARKAAAAEQKKANALVAETRTLEQRIAALDSDLAALGSQIGSATGRRTRLESEIDALRAEIDVKRDETARVQASYDAQTAALAARIDSTYRAGDWAYLDMLLGASNLGDLLQRTEFVQRIMLRDEEIANDLHAQRLTLERATEDLNRAVDDVSAKRAEAAAEEDNLRKLRNKRDAARDAQAAAKAAKQSLLAETKANVARLKAIAAAEDAESARIQRLLSGGGSSKGNGQYAGTMTWPCPGYTRIGSGFGMRYHPILHYNRMHTGVDISAPSGATLVSVGSGVVINASVRGGYGKCVMIDHGNGVVSLYAHMSSFSVSVGQAVTPGQRIGAVGSTGLSTGPHLHFEIRVNGNPVNPLGYI